MYLKVSDDLKSHGMGQVLFKGSNPELEEQVTSEEEKVKKKEDIPSPFGW